MDKHINIEGKNIYYRVTGTGRPVVLVHGFGEDGEIWDQQVDFLKDTYQLIVPDLPGSGKSPAIDDMSMEGLAEVINIILNKENTSAGEDGEGASLIGHSMGGYIALAFAQKYPRMLHSFGLFHSSAYADNEEKKSTRRKGIEFVKEHGAFEFFKTATPKLFSSLTKEKNPALIEKQVQSLEHFSDKALIAYYEAMINRPDRTDVLKKAEWPVLFIIGEEDAAIPMKDMLEQSYLPSQSHIHVLTDTGHMGMLEKPLESNAHLSNFLAR